MLWTSCSSSSLDGNPGHVSMHTLQHPFNVLQVDRFLVVVDTARVEMLFESRLLFEHIAQEHNCNIILGCVCNRLK